MVPFIDVMLVLLIIFMVSAPLITTGVVDLPSVGKAGTRPASVIEVVVVAADGQVTLRKDAGTAQPSTLARLSTDVRQLQGADPLTPVVISAERSVRYDAVVNVMDVLQKAGVRRVGLSVKQGG